MQNLGVKQCFFQGVLRTMGAPEPEQHGTGSTCSMGSYPGPPNSPTKVRFMYFKANTVYILGAPGLHQLSKAKSLDKTAWIDHFFFPSLCSGNLGDASPCAGASAVGHAFHCRPLHAVDILHGLAVTSLKIKPGDFCMGHEATWSLWVM